MGKKEIVFVLAVLLGWAFPLYARADASLTVTPITWNVIGLDSNSPADGPNRFPVGVRVCNTGTTTASDVLVAFAWDDGNDLYAGDPHINLRPGSLATLTIPAIAAGKCSDAYFEVELAQDPAAFDRTRRYHVTATDSLGATGASPRPRELYVEHLISQNRNGITSIALDGTPIPAGGTMTLMVGHTYTIALQGFTATQGYSQLESFINFPNTIFRIESVSTTYTANTSPYVASPDDRLYADACLWENDPDSPNYRACVGGAYKAGGEVTITYTVKVISGAGTSQSLNTLLYDFSGSSFHYNADYVTGFRIADIIGPASVTIAKTFDPKAMAPGGTATMTFRLSNPTPEAIGSVHFSDSFPPGLKVADPTGVSYDGCGPGTFSPAPTPDDTSVSFSNGTLAPNGICTITLDVAAPEGSYPNTTGNLFINDSEDTGNFASDTLTVASTPPCIPGQILAHWTVPSGATSPPDTGGSTAGGGSLGYPTITNTGYAATAYHFPLAKQSVVTGTGSPDRSPIGDDTSWLTYGYKNDGGYVEFQVDTRAYSDVVLTFAVYPDTNGPKTLTVTYSGNGSGTAASFSTTGGTLTAGAWNNKTIDLSALASTSGTTTIRISGTGANNDNSGACAYFDDIRFMGCGPSVPAPTIVKSFAPDPIVKGADSTLTFVISNTAPGNQALTGVAFTDVLPAGLTVADGTSSQCGGTLTTSAATGTIELTGGALAAGSACTFDAAVTGAAAGQYDNVTGFVASNESGPSTHYATASLGVIAPPALAKSFAPTSLLTGGTSTLTFALTNPNQFADLTGVAFSDSLPAGLTVADGGPTVACGGSWSTAAPGSISFTGGSLAPNSTCTFSVTVTGAAPGSKDNTTSAVTSAEGGNGESASATLTVSDPVALIGLNKQVSTDGTNWYKFVGVPVGADLYYRFTVSNEGETPLASVDLSDPNVSLASCSLPVSLAIGESAACTVGPLPAVFGLHANTATASGAYDTQTLSAMSTARYGTTALSIVKDAAETHFTAAGEVLHYSYLVTNSGFAPLAGPVTVADDKSNDEACPAVTTVGNLDADLDPGESITCTATYTVQAGDAAAGSVTNTATASAGGVTSDPAQKTVSGPALPPQADLAVTKTSSPNPYVPGAALSYTVVVSNQGPSGVTGARVQDTLPAALAAFDWTCTPSGAGAACGTASGTGDIDALVDLPAGTSATFAVTGAVPSGVTGQLANSASVTPPAGTTDPDPANATAGDTNEAGPESDLSITKTDGSDTAVPGQAVTYTIVVTNSGPSDVSGATVVDTFPAALTGVTYTSVTTGTVSGNTPSGAGHIHDTVNMTAGSTITYTVTGTIAASAAGSLVNTATVSVPPGVVDPIPGNNTATDTDALQLPMIPTLTGWGMTVFALLAALGSIGYLRRKRGAEGKPGL